MNKVLFFVVALAASSFAASTPHRKYVYPCQVGDAHCVRDNMAANSMCRKVVGSAPAVWNAPASEFDAPYFNASYVDNNLVYKNLDKCFVSAFYYNVDADVAVVSVDCPYLTMHSNRTLIQHASGLEDTYYSFDSNWEYPLVRFTINIKNANNMNLCNSYVFTDVVYLPNFILSPNDVQTEQFLSNDLSYMNIYERECWYKRGFSVCHEFFRTTICDFGCAF